MQHFSIQLDNHKFAERPISYRFSELVHIIECRETEDVARAFSEIENAVRSGMHAAGFLCYEAASAMDSVYQTQDQTDLPLMCFGVFKKRQEVCAEILHDFSSRSHILDMQPDITREQFNAAISRIHSYIASGDTYQVNFTFRLNGVFSGHSSHFYQQMCHNQRAEFSALIQTDDYAIISASPELFFRWQNGVLETRPMKGTVRRGRNEIEDLKNRDYLLTSEKERAENVMIVDLMRNDMNRISRPGSVHVPALFKVEKYETLMQMTSSVRSKLAPDTSFFEVFKALFPCGSITGAPKIKTMSIIKNLENSARGIYTGNIGYFSPGPEAVFSVAIRTAIIQHKTRKIQLGVGSGITIGSNAAAEYDESLLKSKFIFKQCIRFQLVETMRFEMGRGIFLLENHLQRLAASARYFIFAYPSATVIESLQHFVETTKMEAARIRLLLSRDGSFQIQVMPFKKILNPKPVLLKLCNTPVQSSDVFLFHKTTHRHVYNSRRAEVDDCDDIIMMNEKGEVTESCIGNIIVQRGDRWLTPPVSSGLLAGTYRQHLLQEGRIEEQIITRRDLLAAEKICRINSVRGMEKCILAID